MESLGQRIHVMGNSCSGKSTLAARLGAHMNVPVVELDALNWLPNWVGLNATDPDELERRIRAATEGDAWVVAGSYTAFCRATFWPRLQTMIWLDLPRWQLLLRVLRRSWRRSRSQELLWGTNTESFWQQLKVWEREESLVWWIWTQYHRKRAQMLALMADPECAHFRVIRLTSSRELARYLEALGVSAAEPAEG